MLGYLHHALKGKASVNFYTDSWPEYSALVCEQVAPVLPYVSFVDVEL